MNSIFISGIPAVGKSFLADKLSKELNITHVDTDDWREEVWKDKSLRKWVDFFLNQDEEEYWKVTTCEQHWQNLVNQSEAFWPTFRRNIEENKTPVIFEGVNLLPHLMKQTNLKGIYLINISIKEIFERNKKDPRWGKTEELQKKEAEIFVNCEASHYKEEANKNGYPVFENTKDVEELLRVLITS